MYNREQTIKDLSYTAGEEENIRLGNTIATHPDKQSEQTDGNYMLVEYSEKAVAVFGETRAIKEELKAMGGRFNSRLTHNGKKSAGWIFPKSQEERLALYFGLN
ncbi:hypothetical protein CS543_09410 [Porphyromonas gingivalis]|uniref:hypothetical protein n=1 Tax=Porphyromonas gingivalis TaxID=837 RepID=UPI000C17435D|nr:hypothetical protein [Porphyromonas gingivalis]ATS11012.1 hypothetical protein CS543_09410 [Porphyromonas gingivalis]